MVFFRFVSPLEIHALYVFYFSLFFLLVQDLMYIQIWLFLVVVGVFLLSHSDNARTLKSYP